MDAKNFAIEAHGDQKRKYTGEPYWKHLEEVADLVGSVDHSYTVRLAWLHDVLEDTQVTYEDLKKEFGEETADDVLILSDLTPHEEGNRAYRKAKYREQISKGYQGVQTVKLADLISNTPSIVLHDPGFAKVYLKEKQELLEVLKGGNSLLWKIANNYLQFGLKIVGEV